MKLILSFALATGMLLGSSASALAVSAPPVPTLQTGHIVQVRDGCGRYYHRNHRGRCVSDWYWTHDWGRGRDRGRDHGHDRGDDHSRDRDHGDHHRGH